MSARPQPFFLDAGGRRLFAVQHLPSGPIAGHVLCIPAFSEDMNRCRSMVTLQAQRFARHGLATLVLDLYGTGDSDGEHGDATWQTWLDDIQAACRWIEERGELAVLWGIRSGALLAAQIGRQREQPMPTLLLWQPVCDGKQFFTQFLRLRVAAQLERAHLQKETTASLRASLTEGKNIEVAGYEIAPELGLKFDEQRLDSALPNAKQVLWFEQRIGDAEDPLPASAGTIAAWRTQGQQLSVGLFTGPPFWQVHERAVASDLLERTELQVAAVLAGEPA